MTDKKDQEEGQIIKSVMSTMGGILQVEVQDGEILRIRPIQLQEEDLADARWSIDIGDRTFAPPGRVTLAPYSLSFRRRIYNPMRLQYPMKRVDFKPGGKGNPEGRGKGEFVRTSWEEALDIVSEEINRVREEYGPAALLPMYMGHFMWGSVHTPGSHAMRFFDMLGTTGSLMNPNSWEGWFWGSVHTFGFQREMGFPPQTDLLEDVMKHSELILWWSCDPEKTSWGYTGQDSALWRLWIKELGKKQVFIDPFCNYTAGLRADKWIAPIPGTDAALASAIAYEWIRLGSYDREYIDKHTYGFDKWEDYILGREDSLPKTPSWAEPITGVKAGIIRALAKEWASKKTSLAIMFGGACRTPYGHEWARMMVYLQAMQGLGKPGVNIWDGSSGSPQNRDFRVPNYRPLPPMVASAEKVPRNAVKQRVYQLLTPECILSPPVSWTGAGMGGSMVGPDYQFKKYTYPREGESEVKMIFRWGTSHFSTLPAGNRRVRMYKSPKIECVVAQTPWRGGEAEFADVLLPACTLFERNDISTNGRNYNILVYHKKCIEPLYESKNDYEIFCLLAEKLGFKEEYTEGNSEEDWIRKTFEKSSLPDHISYEKFKDKGYFVTPIPKDYHPEPTFRSFYETGEGLETPTGKIEFFSKRLEQYLPDDTERPPMARYLTPWEGQTSPLSEKYPLLLVSSHPRYSFHTHGENVSWIRSIPLHRVHKDGYDYWPVQIHPSDAAPRGVQDGDLVKVYNDRAEVVLIARVTEKIRPGSVFSVSAGGYDPLEPGKIGSVDKGGAVNLLMPEKIMSPNAPGQVTQGLVEIEKWEG
jgi:trimethylamine-N-oxide reductase (cytochrome c)